MGTNTMILRWILLFSTLLMAVACSPTEQEQALLSGVELAQAITPTPEPELSPLQRTTYTVMRGDVREEFTFRGRWLPRDQAQLAFEVAGNVRSVNVQRGDTVRAGDIMADLQIDDLENQLQSQLIQLESAQRRLNESGGSVADQVRDAQFDLADAQLQLDGQRASLPWTDVANAQLQVDAAERRLELAERAYNDAVSRPDTPASQVDSAYNELQSARENLATQQNNYNRAAASYYNSSQSVAQQENRVLQRELALQQSQQGGGTDPDLLDAVREAQLTVDRTQEQIAQSTLTAPFDGVVLEITIQPGDSVTAFTGVITLALPEPNEMIASIPFNEIQLLQVGQIGVCQESNRLDTRVQCIIRQLPLSNRDVDQTVRVAATLPQVQQGALIEATMTLQERTDTLYLPPQAVNSFNNRQFVVLLTPDGERVQDVTVGLETDTRIEILSGVAEGDVVVQQ